ncbi:hypothetical protein CMU89_17140 [Elizabethkingia anophelis]|nr:hypothetical protein [Elizabethkingia anophelis]MDV3544367.1 hypothetical protein [Elizabethkingia anophelis]
MSDNLAVIQAAETQQQLKLIDAEVQALIITFKSLVTVTNEASSAFKKGTPKEFLDAQKKVEDILKRVLQQEEKLASINQKLAKTEENLANAAIKNAKAKEAEARAVTQEERAKKEAANATIAQTRAQKAQEAQTNANIGAYKRLSNEANQLKNVARNLEAEILLLTRDFKTGVISQEQYNKELAKLQGQFNAVIGKAKNLDTELKRIDANVGDRRRNVGNYQEAAMSSVKRLETQIKSMLTMYVGFQAIWNGTGKLIHNNYELSDSLVDLQIRLHGNKKATDELFESLKNIETRTSLGELVNTAAIVAKKGVAKEEIEGITKALDDYFIVAGKEAGNREEGTASIIKLISIFHEDKRITADRVTEISTALVKLQNSGVATGSRMIDVAERIGSIRGITGVTLPQVLGFAAAIEQLGQKSEVAGTAGMQILTKILSDMPKYAKIANMSVKDLRKAYSDNPFEAVVKVAEGVLQSGDFEKISQDLEEVGVRGARVKGVLGDIAGNADFVRKRIKEAGLAINEEGYLAESAAKKQETFAATVDKIKKEFELLGASNNFRLFIKDASTLLLNFIKLLTAIPFGVVITGLALLTAGYAYLKGAAIQAFVVQQWNNAQSLLGIARTKAARLGLLGEAEALRANTISTQANTTAKSLNVVSLEAEIAAERTAIAALTSKTVADEVQTIAIRQEIAARQAHIVALEAEIIATETATVAQTGLNAATKASPLGWILAGLSLILPLLMSFTEQTEKATTKVKTLADNQKDLNDALKKGASEAGTEVSELEQLYRKANDVTKSTKERKEAVKKLKDEYPSYFDKINDEIIMNGKAEDSYKSLREAIISAARADAIQAKLKGRASSRLGRDEEIAREREKAVRDYKNATDTEVAGTGMVSGGNELSDRGSKRIVTKAENQAVIKKIYQGIVKRQEAYRKSDEEEDRILTQMLDQEEAKAKKLRDDRANRLGKFSKGEEDDKGKEKKYGGAKLTGEQKDAVSDISTDLDKQLTKIKKKRLEGLLDEEAYWEEYAQIYQNYKEKIQGYLKGDNAKERKLNADAEKKAYEALEDANNKIFDSYKKRSESVYKLQEKELQNQLTLDKENPLLSETDKINAQSETYNNILKLTNDYYKNLIAKAKETKQELAVIKSERDAKVDDLFTNIVKNSSQIPDAIIKDAEYLNNIAKVSSELSNEEQKRLIISNKRLDEDEKKFALSQLDKNNTIKQNELEIQNLKIKRDQLITQMAISTMSGGLINQKDIDDMDKLNLDIKKLENGNIQLKIDINSDGIDETLRQAAPALDSIKKSLSDFGLDSVSNKLDETFKKIKDKTFEWKDATILAASAIGDAMSSLVDRQKQLQISALDEQLKRSQANSELELNLIQSRIDALNNMGVTTQEQYAQRAALEDEARVIQEQQLEREKMIAIQKARAEQRADAQKALINGAVGATQTIADMGFVAGWPFALASLAFGVLQSGLIMSRNPVPEYYVGTENAKAGLAWTQERGREVITDKSGNIKSFGSDSGPQLTMMQAGDKVLTADKTKKFLSEFYDSPIGTDSIYQRAMRKQVLPPMMTVNNKVNADEIAEKVGQKFDKTMAKYSTASVYEIDGFTYKERPGKYPEVVGKAKKQSINVKISKNGRD